MASQNSIGELQKRTLPSAVDSLESSIASLEANIYNLSTQLRPVLDDVLDKCEDGVCKGTIEPLQVAEKLSRAAARVRSLNELVLDLSSRLHV